MCVCVCVRSVHINSNQVSNLQRLFLFLLGEQRAEAGHRRAFISSEQLALELKTGGVRPAQEAAIGAPCCGSFRLSARWASWPTCRSSCSSSRRRWPTRSTTTRDSDQVGGDKRIPIGAVAQPQIRKPLDMPCQRVGPIPQR